MLGCPFLVLKQKLALSPTAPAASMTSAVPDASPALLAAIRENGPLTFAQFMEIALYGEGVGFYACGARRVGKAGDFVTAVSAGSAFGAVIAEQLAEIHAHLAPAGALVVVEQGAGDGWLAKDILDHANPTLRASLDYGIVEPFPALREQQALTLGDHAPRVRWFPSLESVPPFEGVHLSNELIDALPFHLLEARGGTWLERHVDQEMGRFVWKLAAPCARIADEVARLPARPDGYLAECRPDAADWIRRVAARIERGCVLAFDYGMDRARLLDPGRTRGTFACYQNHHRDENPLENPGEKDITAHVDFTGLEETARQAGLDPLGRSPLGPFVVGAGERLIRACEGVPDSPLWKGLKSLIHPEAMGSAFHALAFAKGPMPRLSGFRFRPK